jgi:hypothetical protein
MTIKSRVPTSYPKMVDSKWIERCCAGNGVYKCDNINLTWDWWRTVVGVSGGASLGSFSYLRRLLLSFRSHQCHTTHNPIILSLTTTNHAITDPFEIISYNVPWAMSPAFEEPPFVSMTSDTEQLNVVSTNSLKYPHTRAILTAIAASAKLSDSEGLDADQDGNDGQRISPALVSRVVTLLQEEKEDELKDHLKQAFSIPDTVVSDVLV